MFSGKMVWMAKMMMAKCSVDISVWVTKVLDLISKKSSVGKDVVLAKMLRRHKRRGGKNVQWY